jgi:DNA-binding transcriptional LysR family regulator
VNTHGFKTLHHWHWISSALCLIGMLLFAATGITLNHASSIESTPTVVNRQAQLPPELLAAVAEKLPRRHLHTTEVDLADLAEGVANGTFELGIGYDLVDDPRLKRWPLFTLPPYVLLSGEHRLATRDSIDLAELADEPMVLLDLPHSRDYFQSVFAAAGVTPNIRFRSTTVETCRALVGRGLAYCVLNLRAAVPTALDGHPVAAVPISGDPPSLTVILLDAVAARPTRRAGVVAELCRTLFANPPGV